MQDRLDVKLMIPGRNLPSYAPHIIAHVNYQGETKTYKFGRNQSISHIWSQIPRLVKDAEFDEKIRERAVLSLDAARNRRKAV